MASAKLNSLSEQIDNKMDLFKQNIKKNKAEVTRITEEMKQLLDKKSDALLKELDNILKKVNDKEKKLKEDDHNIKEIRDYQEAMEDLFRKMDPSFTQMTEVSERIETVKKEMDTEIPVVKLNWKLNALRNSINNMCCCNVQEIQNSPVTPKPTPCYGKLGGNEERHKLSINRVIAYFDVQGKEYAIHGTIFTKFSDKSHQIYYELHTDNPVPLLVRGKEIKLKAQRTTTIENSLFVRDDQCAPENLVSRK